MRGKTKKPRVSGVSSKMRRRQILLRTGVVRGQVGEPPAVSPVASPLLRADAQFLPGAPYHAARVALLAAQPFQVLRRNPAGGQRRPDQGDTLGTGLPPLGEARPAAPGPP